MKKDREKEIKRLMYEKSEEKKEIIKQLKALRRELMELQGMQNINRGMVKTKKRR